MFEQPRAISASELDTLFVCFADAEEVGPIQASFDLLLQGILQVAGIEESKPLFSRSEASEGEAAGLAFYTCLRNLLLPQISGPEVSSHARNRQKLFAILDAKIEKCKSILPNARQAQGNQCGSVLVCGAGPCGLRCGIEAALCGHHVTIVEKRSTASRANILTLWEETHSDLLAMGVQCLYPGLEPGWIGTREMQLALLKISLILGVKVIFGAQVAGLCPPDGGCRSLWRGRIQQYIAPVKKAADAMAARKDDSHQKAVAQCDAQSATGFKQDKTAGYSRSAGMGKCNRIEEAEIDAEFLGIQGTPKNENLLEVLPFDALYVAEGEWSNTTRKLGFRKTIDTFNRSIGLIINMKYNRTCPTEVALKPFVAAAAGNMISLSELGQDNGAIHTAPLKKLLQETGVGSENMEYLKGETHYIALCAKKKGLLNFGVLKEDLEGSKLLSADNISMPAFKDLTNKICSAIGLPDTVEPYPVNPMQIFDFSSRARCFEACRILARPNADASKNEFVLPPTTENAKQAVSMVYVVGDALLEPFWPQGLGINRGFHGCLNATYSLELFLAEQKERAIEEANFAYRCMTFGTWYPGENQYRYIPRYLEPQIQWTCDPATRFSKRVFQTVLADHGLEGVPSRIQGLFSTEELDPEKIIMDFHMNRGKSGGKGNGSLAGLFAGKGGTHL